MSLKFRSSGVRQPATYQTSGISWCIQKEQGPVPSFLGWHQCFDTVGSATKRVSGLLETASVIHKITS